MQKASVTWHEFGLSEFSVFGHVGSDLYSTLIPHRHTLGILPSTSMSKSSHPPTASSVVADILFPRGPGQRHFRGKQPYLSVAFHGMNYRSRLLLPAHPNIVTLYHTLEASPLLLLPEYVPGQDNPVLLRPYVLMCS